jgi:uncharacterized protein
MDLRLERGRRVSGLRAIVRLRGLSSGNRIAGDDMSFLASRAFAPFAPIVLLLCSNVFMTFAWYGHLKFKDRPLLLVILVSWGIAFIEYCFAVPANRFGSRVYSAAELKTMQEVITLCVFAVFSVTYLQEALRWQTIAGFVLIAAGAFLVFQGKS